MMKYKKRDEKKQPELKEEKMEQIKQMEQEQMEHHEEAKTDGIQKEPELKEEKMEQMEQHDEENNNRKAAFEHTFERILNGDEKIENENENKNHQYCVVVIGSSGVGKSALIKIHCGEKVKIGDGVDSETKDAQLFDDTNELYKNNRKWMDTQGALDSEGKQTDPEILSKIIKKNYMNVKLII